MPDIKHDPCPGCGRPPAPRQVLHGWHPCLCRGHRTRYCRPDAGGCGETMYVPPLGERCREPAQGFTPPRL